MCNVEDKHWKDRFPRPGTTSAGKSTHAATIIFAFNSMTEPEWYEFLSDLLEHGTADPDINRLFNTDRDYDIIINVSFFIERTACSTFGLAADAFLTFLLSARTEIHLRTLRSLLCLFSAVRRGPPWDSIRKVAFDASISDDIRAFAAMTLIDYGDRPACWFWDELQPRKNYLMIGPYMAAIAKRTQKWRLIW